MSDDARPAGPLRAPRRSEDEIRAIAREIRDAIRRRPPDPLGDSILSRKHELSPEEEDRVIAALGALRADAPGGAP